MNISSRAAFFPWRPAAWLRAHGPDALNFLQGQFTNELRGLAAGGAAYGLWLNVKGKVLADSFVLRGAGADEYWIGSYFSPADVIRQRLESFLIADDVTIEDQTTEWRALTVFGPDEQGGEIEKALSSPVFRFRGRRSQSDHCELVFRAQRELPADLASPSDILDASELDRRRIEDGIPAVPRDIGPGELPNEGGLEATAISYTKGCYLGQEVMARLKAMGQVRRRLLRVELLTSAIPALPAPLYLGERQVGELRSASTAGTRTVGLALVSLLHLKPDSALGLSAGGVPAVRLIDTP